MSNVVSPTARPIPFQGDLSNLPEALAPLKALPNWICWRWEWKLNKKGVGKWDKPPFNPAHPHRYAKNNDSSTWGTYEQALAVFQRGGCDGIGFNLSATEFAAFDIDDCRDPATGGIAPEAMAIVDRATSYTEMTVSGTGLRVIGHGSGKKVHRKQKLPNSDVEVESYSNAERYIVITGNPLPNAWPHVADISSEMDDVVAELDGQKGNVLALQSPPYIAPAASASPTPSMLAELAIPDHLRTAISCPTGDDLSKEFHRVVCGLGDRGWDAAQIETIVAGKPIVPERYANRLTQEIERCLRKAKPKQEAPASAATSPLSQSQPPIELFWHGGEYGRELRPMLIKDLVPETGKGLASGQWGTAKTFCMIDLSASVMTGTPFAGREVVRQGGVLFVAAEGAIEIPIRLQGLVEHKLRPTALASGVMGEPGACRPRGASVRLDRRCSRSQGHPKLQSTA